MNILLNQRAEISSETHIYLCVLCCPGLCLSKDANTLNFAFLIPLVFKNKSCVRHEDCCVLLPIYMHRIGPL